MTLAALFASQPPPALPEGAQSLIDSYALPLEDVPPQAVLAPLAADPAWRDRTLRLASAPCWQQAQAPATLAQALAQLGLARLRNLALAAALDTLPHPAGSVSAELLRRFGLETACSASWLAQALEEDADAAFAIGLLLGLGHPVLHAAWPQAVAALNQAVHPLAPQRAEAETGALGVAHPEVSAELARRWGFAPTVAEPLAWVHQPVQAGRWATLAGIAHLAAWRVGVDLLAWPGEQAQASCPVSLGRVLGVPFEWNAELGTVAGVVEDLLPPMPAPAELSQGLVQALG